MARTDASRQARKTGRGPGRAPGASQGGGGAGATSSGGGVGLRSGKGGGEPASHAGVARPDRPASGGNRTGTNPGFTEEQTKDIELSSGGGLSQEDPDPSLRGEDQLVDGDGDRMHEAFEEE